MKTQSTRSKVITIYLTKAFSKMKKNLISKHEDLLMNLLWINMVKNNTKMIVSISQMRLSFQSLQSQSSKNTSN
jgi:hypothetical protein